MSKSQHELHGKSVLITGGSSGIGRATALRMAACGCRVSLASRNQEVLNSVVREIESFGAEAIAVPTDVTQSEQCKNAVEETVQRFGGLDIVVCSAGLSMRAFFEDADLTAMERIMRINFFGTLYTTHFALPSIKAAKGSLVAISSLTGKRGMPAYSIYGASKFAVQGLYESLHLELKREGVHVGVVAPGFVETPILQKVLGPNGEPWDQPPPLPFRKHSVEKCVDCVLTCILKRRREVLLPWSVGPLFLLDRLFGSQIGDATLRSKFPPEAYRPGSRNPSQH